MDCQLNMTLLCILIQFVNEINVHVSLIIFDAIYSITFMVNNILNDTASETIVQIFFPATFEFFSKYKQVTLIITIGQCL